MATRPLASAVPQPATGMPLVTAPARKPLVTRDVFSVPVLDRRLIYAPLHDLVALVDARGAETLRVGLSAPASTTFGPSIVGLLDRLRASGAAAPTARDGPVEDPLFLGLIPTRGCNMACPYCDFAAPKAHGPVMSRALARRAIDAYFDLIVAAGGHEAGIQLFGGEPFFAADVVHFIVGHAWLRAEALGLRVRFEATTNGFYGERECRWIADHFDTVVLSLDGPPEVHDRQRPDVRGHGTFATVFRNAEILSRGQVDLVVRVCVTQASVERMPELAAWLAQALTPQAVCFEPMTASSVDSARAAAIDPPDAWSFARGFHLASRILEARGIETILSTAQLGTLQVSFCPIGKDALIVSPDGAVDACYQLEDDWRAKDLDLRLGWIGSVSDDRAFALDSEAVRRVRSLNVWNRPLCADCLCRYHCAGACHIHHDTARAPGDFDALCVYTRLVTVARLLERLDQPTLVDRWFADVTAQAATVWQRSDRLSDSVSAMVERGEVTHARA